MKPNNHRKQTTLCGRGPGLGLVLWLTFCGIGASAQQAVPAATAAPAAKNVDQFIIKTLSPENRAVPFYVRIPAGFVPGKTKAVHRAMLLCGHLRQDGLAVLNYNRPLCNLADERGWFLIAPSFYMGRDTDPRDRSTCYYYPEKFSGKAVTEALEQIQKKYPIATNGLFVQGFSGGAQFAHRLAIWAPDRFAAVSANSSSWFDPPTPESCQVAWLLTIGESDPALDATLAFASQLRDVQALPIVRSYLGLGHMMADGANVRPMITAFFAFYDEVTKAKLGAPKSLKVQKPQPPLGVEAMPFIGDSQDWKYHPAKSESVQDIPEELRVYLPNEKIAKMWGDETNEAPPP